METLKLAFQLEPFLEGALYLLLTSYTFSKYWHIATEALCDARSESQKSDKI